jgi:hypothetical protein
MVIVWQIRLPKRVCRRVRLFGAICRMNGKLREKMATQIGANWWHRNSGRLLELDAKWFGHNKSANPPNVRLTDRC